MIKVIGAFTVLGLLGAVTLWFFVIYPLIGAFGRCRGCRRRDCSCGSRLHPR